MPDTFTPPVIPTTPVTPAILEALRAIVGDKGLIVDDAGKEPFVRDWRGVLAGNAAVVVRPASATCQRGGPKMRAAASSCARAATRKSRRS